jgi:hypothetical protein
MCQTLCVIVIFSYQFRLKCFNYKVAIFLKTFLMIGHKHILKNQNEMVMVTK